MKKILFTFAMVGLLFATSCDPKDKVQEDHSTSEEVLGEDKTPSQYEGSTGVEDDNNNMEANENIELKGQDFKGSFSSPKTQSYVFTVLEKQEYSFSLTSDNPNVQYLISHKDGDVVQEATKEDTTLTLEPGEYTILGSLGKGDGTEANPETEFTVHIK